MGQAVMIRNLSRAWKVVKEMGGREDGVGAEYREAGRLAVVRVLEDRMR